MKKREAATFEESLERLERTIHELESGDLALEEALARFEEGVRLARECRARLESVEGRIAQLLDSGETVTLTPESAD